MTAGRITLRAARDADARFVWEVNNHPTTRAQSIRTGDIAWDDHAAWFAEVLGDARRRLWLAQAGDEPVGVVRMDDLEAGGQGTISVAMHPGHRGRGFGTAVIAAACADAKAGGLARSVLALVRPDNTASVRAFEKVGFVIRGLRSVEGVELFEMIYDLDTTGDET